MREGLAHLSRSLHDSSRGSNFQVFLARQRANGLSSGAFSNSVSQHRPLILTGARAAFDSIHALRRDAPKGSDVVVTTEIHEIT